MNEKKRKNQGVAEPVSIDHKYIKQLQDRTFIEAHGHYKFQAILACLVVIEVVVVDALV